MIPKLHFYLFSNYTTKPHFFSSLSLSTHLHKPHFIEQHLHRKELLFSLLKSCLSNTHLLQLHTQFIRTHFIQHPRLSLKFLTKASSIFPHNLIYLLRVFSQFSAPGVSHYNVMIMAFARSERPSNGFKFYRKLKQDGLVSDSLTMSFCVKCCVKELRLFEGLQVHARALVDGFLKDSVLMTGLMDLYSGCGKCRDAYKVFDEMSQRDTVACNVMISCLMRNKRTRDVLAVFDTMQRLQRHCRPDDVTCLLSLQACADLGALEFGVRIRGFVEEQGYGNSVKLKNALITMYSKCGNVDEAYSIFKEMGTKNLVTWSAMISGFAMNGYGHDALEKFREMQEMGITPDDMVFTSVLYACSHSGFLDEGLAFFDRMIKEFKVIPNIHHYGCVVDLLGRSGLLNQAYDLIISMKPKPDAKIWRTLLAACRIHRNFDIAERVIEHIVELKAQEAGDYVLLLNTYSLNGKRDKVSELRKFMNQNNIVTAPGSSTTEIKGVVHEFVANDIAHPRKDEIYIMLKEIMQQLKMAGYVSEVLSEFHNLGDEEKVTSPSYHSQKLAIAFVVLATPPGATIRVANSVRTCVDCHNFAKVLSLVYNRKVIIRDQSRLHHIREGQCSCGDFW